MADIFISYSSKDREQAQLLTELLASAGLSVWIDQAGIGAATSWSGEISKAITDCKTLIVLLSPSSIDSKNVTREVALAFERNKKILPIDLEPVTLPDDFAYHLAGIQRAPMTNIDAIIRALAKLGLEATGAPQLPRLDQEANAGKKSLMILPFHDLSPTGDNGWFADGIVSELIQALSNVKALHLTDAQTTRDFKRYQGPLPAYAKATGVRYFVEGDVRKFGDQIKVNSRLLDIETGEHLWQDSMKGVMNDIFEIQEKVAEKVVEGLKVHLAFDEKKKLTERGTENPEAYELYLKACADPGYAREDYQRKIDRLNEATALDPNYARAYGILAVTYANYYRAFGGDADVLALQKEATERAVMLAPELPGSYNALANLYTNLGEHDKAIETARKMVIAAPEQFHGYSVIAFMYYRAGRLAESALWIERALAISPASLRDHMNLVTLYAQSGSHERKKNSILRAIPHMLQYLALSPEDQTLRALLMVYYDQVEKYDRADGERDYLLGMPEIFGNTYQQIASLYGRRGDAVRAVEFLYKAARQGFVDFDELCHDNEWFGCVQSLPQFERIISELKAIIAKASA